MTYGGVDSTWKCKQDFQYFDLRVVDQTSPLAFDISGFQFDDYTSRRKSKAVLDTGVSVLYFPDRILNVLTGKLDTYFDDNLQLYMTDCSKAAGLKDWVFTIGVKEYRLEASQYIIDIRAPQGRCVAAIDSSFYPAIDFIFGMPMLRPYCSAYNLAKNQVGLATAIHGNIN